MLDEEFTNINMMLKYYKFGFGRATDYVDENKAWRNEKRRGYKNCKKI